MIELSLKELAKTIYCPSGQCYVAKTKNKCHAIMETTYMRALVRYLKSNGINVK